MAALSALLGIGCTHELPPRVSERAATQYAAEVAPQASAPVAPRAPEVIGVVPAPSERVCSLSSTRWSGALKVGPALPTYGFVSDGPVKLSLGAETRDGSGFAEAGGGRLRLVGVVDKPEIFTKSPMTLASFVIPLAKTALGWQPTGEVGRVGVSLDISDAFELPGVVEKAVSCDKLTIDEPSYNTLGMVGAGAKGRRVIGGGVDLFLSPGLPPIARTKQDRYNEVLVFETRGLHTRVAIQASGYYAVGWVQSAALSETGLSPIGMGGVGTSFGYGSSRRKHCKHDLALYAEVAGTRYIVGSLLTGGDYVASTLDVADGFTALALSERWLRVAPGAKLLVRTQDLAGC